MNKKAITPMISTVMLILFAAGLGALVMTWGASAEAGKAETNNNLCETISIGITHIASEQQICMTDEKIVATLENNGNSDIKGVKITLVGENSISEKEHYSYIEQGAIRKEEIPMEINDKVLKLRIVPFTQDQLCTEKRIEIENIRGCEE